jgi:flavin-dependent dehydrogenase
VADRVDVAVIGAGPAGAAAAIALQRLGRSVLLLNGPQPGFRVGESLPPEATPLLQQLGVWEAFCAAGHEPAVCNESAWGSSEIAATSFIRSPYGRGWHLDRPAFDAMLRAHASHAGAATIDGRVCRFVQGSEWELTIEGSGRTKSARAKWLVDATGRTSWLASRLGVKRMQGVPLTASAVMFGRAGDRSPDADRATLVETMPSGWFYTARLPQARRMAIGFTRTADAPRTLDRFLALVEETFHIRRRLDGYDAIGEPWLVAANSSMLEHVAGPGWIAVGDAACAHDPVSSYGITFALHSAIEAAASIDGALDGSMSAITAFELRMRSSFERYAAALEEVYASERRWPESAFWREQDGARNTRKTQNQET